MYRTARRAAGRRRRAPRRYRRSRGNTLSKRLFNIRNSTVFRPRKPGYNNLALNFARRFIAYPSSGVKPAPDKPAPKSSWWLDALQWTGSLALQLIGIFLAGSSSQLGVEKFAITGAGTAIAISPRDLLMTTAVASRSTDGLVQVPFEQSKILWLKATVTPVVDASIVGGSYACALVPMDAHQSRADLPNDFDSIMRQPGSVIRPMHKPVSVSWSPTLQEHSLKWHVIGDRGETAIQCVAFVIAFSDMALAKQDGGGLNSKEYNPGKSGFELYFDGQVAVRQPGVSQFYPTLHASDPTLIKVFSHDKHSFARFSDVNWDDGFGVVESKNLVHSLSKEEVLSLDDLAL